jgi:hypothetical protein
VLLYSPAVAVMIGYGVANLKIWNSGNDP